MAVHHGIGASHEPARPSSLLIVVEAEVVRDALSGRLDGGELSFGLGWPSGGRRRPSLRRARGVESRVGPQGREDRALVMFLEDRRDSAVQDPSTATSATPYGVELRWHCSAGATNR
jgi:hypothetical protein